MMRSLSAVVLTLTVSGTPGLAAAAQSGHQSGPQQVTTSIDAPLFVGPEATRTPLRTAQRGSTLNVLAEEGEWYRVEFQDPQWGRRVGYVQKAHVTVGAAEPGALTPIDVSVPAPARPPAPESPIADAGARAAAAAAQTAPRTEMPGGLKWTGIGLLAGGGGAILIGTAIEGDYCFDAYDTCDELRTGFYVVGGILAGTGAALLAIGAAKRRPVLSSVSIQHGRLIVNRRVTF